MLERILPDEIKKCTRNALNVLCDERETDRDHGRKQCPNGGADVHFAAAGLTFCCCVCRAIRAGNGCGCAVCHECYDHQREDDDRCDQKRDLFGFCHDDSPIFKMKMKEKTAGKPAVFKAKHT